MALCLPLVATAQSGRADPADSRASAPALRYRSAFADYTPWQDLKPGHWRALNDAVVPAASRPPGHTADGAVASPVPAGKAEGPSAPGHKGHPGHGGKP